MNNRSDHKKTRTILQSMVLLGFASIFTSCMMMAPMHLTRHHSDSTKTTVLYTDPVCRAEIKNDQQELFYDYKGARYHFHSQDCMNTFKSTPEHYATHNSMHHTQNNWMWIAGGIAMGAMMFFVMVL